MGIKGAAAATVIAQYISGIGIFIYDWWLILNTGYIKTICSLIKKI